MHNNLSWKTSFVTNNIYFDFHFLFDKKNCNKKCQFNSYQYGWGKRIKVWKLKKNLQKNCDQKFIKKNFCDRIKLWQKKRKNNMFVTKKVKIVWESNILTYIWVTFFSLHIVHKYGHFFREFETILWQFLK